MRPVSTEEQNSGCRADQSFSRVLVSLMKGVFYRDQDMEMWQWLLNLQARVREHIAPLGLELVLDEAEGHSYLRQRPTVEGEGELPRLIPRRQLSYPVSLLLVLLRKKLAECDAHGADTRLVLNRDQIIDLLRLFLADTDNEARLFDRIDSNINKVVDLGFLRRLRGHDDQFEVRRILKTFVDAQWLNEFAERLANYRAAFNGANESSQEGKT